MHFMTKWISLRRTFNFCEKTLRNKKVRFDRTCARLYLFRCQIYLGNPIINHAKYSQYYMNDTYSLTFHLKNTMFKMFRQI